MRLLLHLNALAGNLAMTGATHVNGDLDGDSEVTLDDCDLSCAPFGVGGTFLSVA